nr:hypothetical protein [Enterocloster lavalensis]
MKQAVKERVVLKKEDAQFLRNGKDTVSMDTGNEFTRHTKSTFLVIDVAA